MVRHIGKREVAFALPGPALAQGEEAAQPAIGRPAGGPGEKGEV
jgi:hypothetical protein